MPVVFIIARDWTLRTAIRAQLRELGIKALGMESTDDLGREIAGAEMPSAILLEGIRELAANPAIKKLVERVPTVLIASRTETVDLPAVAVVLYRPVRIGEIAQSIQDLLQQPRLA